MRSNYGQIRLFTSELLALSTFPIFSYIPTEWKGKNTKTKTKDEYKEILQEMIQHLMHHHKIAWTNHRIDWIIGYFVTFGNGFMCKCRQTIFTSNHNDTKYHWCFTGHVDWDDMMGKHWRIISASNAYRLHLLCLASDVMQLTCPWVVITIVYFLATMETEMRVHLSVYSWYGYPCSSRRSLFGSLVMQNSDPRIGNVCPYLTAMKDTFSIG